MYSILGAKGEKSVKCVNVKYIYMRGCGDAGGIGDYRREETRGVMDRGRSYRVEGGGGGVIGGGKGEEEEL